MSKARHVVPHDGGWAIKVAGSPGYISVFATKQEAIDAARSLVNREGGELIIHGSRGQMFQSIESSSGIGESDAREAVRSIYGISGSSSGGGGGGGTGGARGGSTGSQATGSAGKKSSKKSSAGKKSSTKKSGSKKSGAKSSSKKGSRK